MLKERQAHTMTAEQLSRELTDIRIKFENLRRETKTIGARTSQLYVALDRLKQSAKGNGR